MGRESFQARSEESIPESLSGNVVAGIPACRRGRHLAARKKRLHGATLEIDSGFLVSDFVPPDWKPRIYVSQDGRRYHFQTGFKG
jgi:hypothetical protein